MRCYFGIALYNMAGALSCVGAGDSLQVDMLVRDIYGAATEARN